MIDRTDLLCALVSAFLLPGCALSAAADGGGGTGGTTNSGGTGGGESGTSAATGSSSSGAGGGTGPTLADACVNSAEIVAALSKAKEGEVITLDACTVLGPVVIPAGVTVKGLGIGSSFISGSVGKLAIKMIPGKAPAVLSGVTVRSDSVAAIAAKGPGRIEIADVEVSATHGVGIAVEGLTSLAIDRVSVTGPVTRQNAKSFPPYLAPNDTATHGVVVLGVPEAKLNDVLVTGFADYGALFLDTKVTWAKGGSLNNLGTGLMVNGGSATLESLSLCGAMQGTRKIPAYNGVFLKGAKTTSNHLQVCNGGGFGLFHLGAAVTHQNLTATGNAGPAVWAQQTPSFTLSGDANVIDKNHFAGLVFIDVLKVSLAHTTVSNTKTFTRPFGAGGQSIAVGDGIELIRSVTGVEFTDVTLKGNARTGMLIDIGPNEVDNPLFHMKWTGVTVDASGDATGAICQGTPGGSGEVWAPGVKGWDLGIVRKGASAINDGLVVDPNDFVGVVDPNDIPSPTSITKGGGLAGLGVTGL